MTQSIGACVVVTNSQQQLLLGRRKNSYKAGYYGIPGGRIEPGEKSLAAAQRELAEETGLEVSELTFTGIVKELQGDHDFVHFVFSCEKYSGEPQCLEPDKCEQWQWFDANHLPSPILPSHQAAIELWQQAPNPPLIEM